MHRWCSIPSTPPSSGVTNNVNLGTKPYVGGPPGSAAVTSVRDFVWPIYAPANGAKSTYRGVELTWQHLLENGLGAHVQVTHTSSSADAVNTTPPTTASIGLIYEKGPISADVNWDCTSHYKSRCAQSSWRSTFSHQAGRVS